MAPKARNTPENTETTDTPTETTEHPAKGQPRPRAVVDTIDFNDAADEGALASVAGPRASKWSQILEQLYDGTVAGNVPRDEDGTLKFVRLGTFSNVGGARTQVKAFEDKGLDSTYEFKSQVKEGESFLWARVRETADATDATDETPAAEA